MPCLEQGDTITTNRAPEVNAKVLDDPAVVRMLSTGTAGTFQYYAEEVCVLTAQILQSSRHSLGRVRAR